MTDDRTRELAGAVIQSILCFFQGHTMKDLGPAIANIWGHQIVVRVWQCKCTKIEYRVRRPTLEGGENGL